MVGFRFVSLMPTELTNKTHLIRSGKSRYVFSRSRGIHCAHRSLGLNTSAHAACKCETEECETLEEQLNQAQAIDRLSQTPLRAEATAKMVPQEGESCDGILSRNSLPESWATNLPELLALPQKWSPQKA